MGRIYIVLYKALHRTHKDVIARMNSHISIAKRNLLNFLEHTQLIELSKQQCHEVTSKLSGNFIRNHKKTEGFAFYLRKPARSFFDVNRKTF